MNFSFKKKYIYIYIFIKYLNILERILMITRGDSRTKLNMHSFFVGKGHSSILPIIFK